MKKRTKPTKRRQSTALSILKARLEQSHLIKLQRMFLKHSSTPNLVYKSDLLLDYPNPALDPSRCESYDPQFETDYLLHNLYRKLLVPGLTSNEALDKAAYCAFFKGERKNIRTNRRLRSISFNDEETNTFVMRVQDVIASILGPLDLKKIAEFSRFSSGATADLRLKDSTVQHKFCFESPSVTRCALKYGRFLYKAASASTGLLPLSERLVEGNRVLTVPKSNSTNRTIAAEPTLNMYFQLGVGQHIRRRLRRKGINLNDQSINQELAFRGSLDGSLATIDLENASNSVSYEVVKLFLPADWFELLDDLRSPVGTVLGRAHRYRMFSSMGNGYTFELESLIFFAILKVACRRNSLISVYGDDLIVPTSEVESCIKWLSFFGFDTNLSKTFYRGFFRESCGKHFLKGVEVTPFFVRRIPRGVDIMLLFNNIARWITRDYVRIEFLDILEYVLSLIPKDSQLFGPDGYGDGHLLEVEHITPKCRLKYSRRRGALTFKSVVLTFDRKLAPPSGALCASLLGHTKDNTMSKLSDSVRKRWRLIDIAVQS